MKRNSKSAAFRLPIETTDGVFVAHYSERGLVALDFPGRGSGPGKPPAAVPAPVQQWHSLTVKALTAALAGSATGESAPLDWSGSTEFQRRVWTAMRAIPCGRTRSYSEIARDIGQPAATRAVGAACGANPIPVLVPCHRVLAAHGRLGGFSGGLDWKRTLLAREAPPCFDCDVGAVR